MKSKTKKFRKQRTEIKNLSIHYKLEKSTVNVTYKHTNHIKTALASGKTNNVQDVTNFTLEDKVRIPRLINATGIRAWVSAYANFDASSIVKNFHQIDWRQARALKAWITRRGHGHAVTIVTK
ncbi:hypothetical protein AYK24_00540 [Thermoplasmatales archaeon SG8-52-4]|nr:MAG: hypothetical protein AYK24_00540 [Thermoplasmatales archaeon SG8-52-4]